VSDSLCFLMYRAIILIRLILELQDSFSLRFIIVGGRLVLVDTYQDKIEEKDKETLQPSSWSAVYLLSIQNEI